MGIKKFSSKLSSLYPQSIVKIHGLDTKHNAFDHIYLDLNSVLHSFASSCYSLEILYERLYRFLDSVVLMFNPQYSLFLCVDGVAPKAKIFEQRKRRFQYAGLEPDELPKSKQKQLERFRKTQSRLEHIAKTMDPCHEPFSSLAFLPRHLTPGTLLMVAVDKALRYWIQSRIQQNILPTHVWTFLSGSGFPGEGELKIFQQLRVNDYLYQDQSSPNPKSMTMKNHFKFHKRRFNSLNGPVSKASHLVLSGDVDCVLLALASGIPSIVIVDQLNFLTQKSLIGNVKQKRLSDANNQKSHLPPLVLDSWDISALRCQIVSPFDFSKSDLPSTSQVDGIILDMCFLAMLHGNDYLPSVSRQSFHRSMMLYHELFDGKSFIVNPISKSICINSFTRFVHRLKQDKNFIVEKKHYEECVKNVPYYLGGLIWCLYSYTCSQPPNNKFMYPSTAPIISIIHIFCYLELIQRQVVRIPLCIQSNLTIIPSGFLPFFALPFEDSLYLPDLFGQIFTQHFSFLGKTSCRVMTFKDEENNLICPPSVIESYNKTVALKQTNVESMSFTGRFLKAAYPSLRLKSIRFDMHSSHFERIFLQIRQHVLSTFQKHDKKYSLILSSPPPVLSPSISLQKSLSTYDQFSIFSDYSCLHPIHVYSGCTQHSFPFKSKQFPWVNLPLATKPNSPFCVTFIRSVGFSNFCRGIYPDSHCLFSETNGFLTFDIFCCGANGTIPSIDNSWWSSTDNSELQTFKKNFS